MSHRTSEVRHRYHSQGLAAGGSALLDAINRGKVHLAKFILDAGEYDVVNTRDFNGKTPLIRAVYIKEEKTRCKAFQLLLNKSANVNLQDASGRTALSYACEMRCNDIVRILVQNNVDPDIADHKGNTPLIYSAYVGNDVAIGILIRSFRRLGLNINHANADRQTALLVAARHGFLECAALLAHDGRADVTARDPTTGRTAEDWARARGCSTPEVLPFAVMSAQNVRQMKHLRISHHGKVRGRAAFYDDDEDEEVDSEFKLSPSTEEDRFDEDAVGPRIPGAASAAGRGRGNAEAKAETPWRLGGARRKRLSLPTIRLYSSLDSPGAYYGDQPPQPGVAVVQDQAKNNRGVVGAGKTLKYPVPAGVKAVHPALAARRSREFNRADTDLLPAVTLEDDDEPETGS